MLEDGLQAPDPQPDPDAFAQAARAAPLSDMRFGGAVDTAFGVGASNLSNSAMHFLDLTRGARDNTFGVGSDAASNILSPDQANAQFGGNGLRFNQPISQNDAAFRAHMAARQARVDDLAQRSNVAPLAVSAAEFAGGLFDPFGLPLMALGGPLGEAAGAGFDAALDGAQTLIRSSRIANAASAIGRVGLEGLAANAPYVGGDALLRLGNGDDVTMGDALRDLAIGATFHTGLHFLGEGFGAARVRLAARRVAGGDVEPPSAPADPSTDFAPDVEPAKPYIPPDILDLPESSRQAAFLHALDAATDDRDVDVGQLVDRERNPPAPPLLDEVSAEPQIEGRFLHDDVAVTPRGNDINVRYGLVEARDLLTSHSNDLEPNPDYPQALQPRDRGRMGAMARNFQMEAELNPKLLMNDVSAAGGAPLISPGGEVESGNGRTIALRRSAATGTDAYPRYRAELERRGYDTSGMDTPILVRMRTDPLSGQDRVGLAREMNSDVTERMSPVEQAMSDGRRIDQALLADDDASPGELAKRFLATVAPDQTNTLADADGRLSAEGQRRVRGALLARAYGDQRLVAQVFEGADTPTRRLGEALADAAPAWAKLRAAARAGDVPAALDLTTSVTTALDLVRSAASKRAGVAEVMEQLRGQTELFTGEIVTPEVEALLRLFYRDPGLTKPRAAEQITRALKYYAAEALKVTPGPDLFGAQADGQTARAILAHTADLYARGDAGPVDVVRPPGPVRTTPAEQAAKPPILDLRSPGGDGERPVGEGLRSDAGGRPQREGDGPEHDPGEAAPAVSRRGDAFIAADPDLKRLAEATEALAARHAVDLPAEEPKSNPNTLAEAIRAAAVCMLGEL